MPEPVVEQIAEEIRSRLAATDFVASVTRPKRINDDPCGDFKLTLTQGSRTYNPQLSYPSNPPVVAFNQVFVIAGELRPSEEDATPIETYQNRFESAIRTALTSVSSWWTFGGAAINSDIGVPRTEHNGESVSIMVELLTMYRHPENDATVIR